jgi:hypothetical protein
MTTVEDGNSETASITKLINCSTIVLLFLLKSASPYTMGPYMHIIYIQHLA